MSSWSSTGGGSTGGLRVWRKSDKTRKGSHAKVLQEHSNHS